MLKLLNTKLFFLVASLFALSIGFYLRVSSLNTLPPSPYWEEVALGYDAYSILQTGKDHHGNTLPIVAFESFGDWKPSLYFYTLVPFIKIFGLNEWTVRLPAALCGLLTAVACGVLVYLLFVDHLGKRTAQWLGLLATFLASLNPWLLQFSRGGWEISLATALLSWGAVFWLIGTRSCLNKKCNLLLFGLSGVLLALSMYAQHSARLVAPLLGVFLFTWSFFTQAQHTIKTQAKLNLRLLIGGLVSFILAALICLPLLLNIFSNQVGQRFAETSIFSNIEVIEQSNYYKELSGNSLASRVYYHRYVLFGQEIAKNFLAHFSLDYLFLSGDSNPRHSTGFFGLFYHIDLPLLLLGFYYLATKRKHLLVFVLVWIGIATLPASIATGAPHALRTLPGFPAWIILIVSGYLQFWTLLLGLKISKNIQTVLFAGLLLLYLAEFGWFWRFYTTVYPTLYSQEWQYEYKQMVNEVEQLRQQYPKLPIYITREKGRPAMYYWFYTKTAPELVQQAESTTTQDQGEFLSWKNIKFIDRPDQIDAGGSFILAASPSFMPVSAAFHVLESSQVVDLAAKAIWNIGMYQQN